SSWPLAGVGPREHVDGQPYIELVSSYFLRHPLTQHMPRKMKFSFSGCESDCAQGMIHDLGVIAVHDNGRFGFKVLAGGGLGHKPHQAVVIETFIEEKDLLPVIEALIALHNRYSNRKLRAKSRIKFLVDKFGPEGFVEKYREELNRIHETFADEEYFQGKWQVGDEGPVPGAGAPRKLFAQKQADLTVVPVSAPLGDVTAEQLFGLADLMQQHGLSDIRATQDQNLILVDVPLARAKDIQCGISALGLNTPTTGDNVVSCPGTWTCRLGITASRNVAEKLSGGSGDLSIRVSSCQNGCAHPRVADIGIHGEGKRIEGKLVPHYQLHFAGTGVAGGRIGKKGPEVPAARIDKAIQRIEASYIDGRESDESFSDWHDRQEEGFFNALLSDLILVTPFTLPSVLKDHGDVEDFKVLQLGGGECAGLSQEDVAANFAEAATERSYMKSFLLGRKHEQAIECAEAIAQLVGKSLLHVAKVKHPAETLVDITELLGEAFPEHPQLAEILEVFATQLERFKSKLEKDEFEGFIEALNVWTVLAGEVCQESDHLIDVSHTLPLTEDIAAA
ncbi:MAG: nitrite/sulfite reductase, partial [Gammaproteobacteria bacterium]|nr:nitrite/sulfite reductase [Gammaproteobacteria bacterium]